MNALAVSSFLLVTLIGAQVSAATACPCTCPADAPCPSACSACLTEQSSCDCETDCTASGCPAGYTLVGIDFCDFGFVIEHCRKTCLVRTTQCAACAPHHFGPGCDPCPGGTVNPCSGNGTCNEGISGDGTCACKADFSGPDCSTPVTTTSTTIIPACRGDDVPALACVLDVVPPGECAGERMPQALRDRLDRSRRLLGRAADATVPRRVSRLLEKAMKQLDAAIRRTAKADDNGALSDGCAVALSELLTAVRARAEALASPN